MGSCSGKWPDETSEWCRMRLSLCLGGCPVFLRYPLNLAIAGKICIFEYNYGSVAQLSISLTYPLQTSLRLYRSSLTRIRVNLDLILLCRLAGCRQQSFEITVGRRTSTTMSTSNEFSSCKTITNLSDMLCYNVKLSLHPVLVVRQISRYIPILRPKR